MYLYIEYNDDDITEMNLKVSTDIDKLKAYLKERVERYFHCPWNKIEAKYLCSDDTLTDTFVHYDDMRTYLTWEIKEVESL